MLYRDLLPSRQGGRFIASHIRIPDAGPVPDEVHFHNIRFQLIFCVAGWVRLVYEDQGDEFVLNAGDCVCSRRRSAIGCWRALAASRSSSSPARPCTRRGSTPRCRCPRRGKTVSSTASDSCSTAPPKRRGRHGATAGSSVGTPGSDAATAASLEHGSCGRRRPPSRRSPSTTASCSSGSCSPVRWVCCGTDQPAERLGPGDSVAVPAGMAHEAELAAIRAPPGCEFLEVTGSEARVDAGHRQETWNCHGASCTKRPSAAISVPSRSYCSSARTSSSRHVCPARSSHGSWMRADAGASALLITTSERWSSSVHDQARSWS